MILNQVLVLNKTNLTLEYGQNIDLKDYIEKAEDNIDGNLVEKVIIIKLILISPVIMLLLIV